MKPNTPSILVLAISAALASPVFAAVSATALPAGATVTAGAATLTAGANSLTVSGTGNTVIAYSGGFNVGSAATVTFNGGNFLNIDQSGAASEIDGTINGNATGMFIANANGVVIGNGATINLTAAGGANGGGNFGLAAQDLSGSAQTSAFMSSGAMPLNAANSATGASVNIGTATIIAGSAVVNANGNIVNNAAITTSSSGGTGALTMEAGNQLVNYGTLVNNSPTGGAITSNYSAQINLIAHGAAGPYSLSLVNQPGGVIQANGNVTLVGHDNMLNYGAVTANATNGQISVAAGAAGSAYGSVYDGTQGTFSAPTFDFVYSGDLAGGIVAGAANPQPGNAFQNGMILENATALTTITVNLQPLNAGAARQNVNLVSTTNGINVVPIFASSLISTLANAANGPVDTSFIPSNLFVRSAIATGLGNQSESGAGNTFYWPGLMYVSNTKIGMLATPFATAGGGIVTNANVTTISNVTPNPSAGQGIYFLTEAVYGGTSTTSTLDSSIALQTNAGSNISVLAGVAQSTTLTTKTSVVNGSTLAGLAATAPVQYTPPAM
ncbi:hypothetical protein GALL_201390 [mine drainage metagenome]|uniref:Uncharacterized protein n=1 Tax=mine drainage metagenome TaxID=410659 RepID=A0A1J5RP59_9ZZZZ